MIVIAKETSNPKFTISSAILLRLYFPLVIDLKYLSLNFKCNAIKKINPIPIIS